MKSKRRPQKNRKSIRIYIEGEGGGTEGSARSRKGGASDFRKSWQAFLLPINEFAKRKGVAGKFQCIACGSGDDAYKRFCNLRDTDDDGLRFLVVDSEKHVDNPSETWHAIGKQCPEWADNSNLLLMIQCIETWLVVSLDQVEEYFNSKGRHCFERSKVTNWQNPEQIHRHTVQKALENASMNCNQPYRHVDGNFIIGKVDLVELGEKVPSAKRLKQEMERKIAGYASS